MANAQSSSDQNATYTIDILRHARSGEVYIAKTVALWSTEDANQDCIGHTVTEIAGPLNTMTRRFLTLRPLDWDTDSSFDLDEVNADISDGSLVYDTELFSSSDQNATYTIDILRHAWSGEVYIAKTV